MRGPAVPLDLGAAVGPREGVHDAWPRFPLDLGAVSVPKEGGPRCVAPPPPWIWGLCLDLGLDTLGIAPLRF